MAKTANIIIGMEWRCISPSILSFVFLVCLQSHSLFGQISITYELVNVYAMEFDIPGIVFPEAIKRSTLHLYENHSVWQDDSIKVISFNSRDDAKISVNSKLVFKKYNSRSQFKKGVLNSKCCVQMLDIPQYKWEIDKTKIKEILGLRCFYAEVKSGKSSYEAWYTEEVGLVDGPERFGFQLPGLILELVNRKTKKTYSAIDIRVSKKGMSDELEELSLDDKTQEEMNASLINREIDPHFIITKDYPINEWVDIRFE